MKKLRV